MVTRAGLIFYSNHIALPIKQLHCNWNNIILKVQFVVLLLSYMYINSLTLKIDRKPALSLNGSIVLLEFDKRIYTKADIFLNYECRVIYLKYRTFIFFKLKVIKFFNISTSLVLHYEARISGPMNYRTTTFSSRLSWIGLYWRKAFTCIPIRIENVWTHFVQKSSKHINLLSIGSL